MGWKNFVEGCRTDFIGRCWPLLPVITFLGTKNHVRFVVGRQIACKRLVDVSYKRLLN